MVVGVANQRLIKSSSKPRESAEGCYSKFSEILTSYESSVPRAQSAMTIWRIWYSLMDRRDRLPINLALIDLILRAPKIHLLREEHSHLSRKRSLRAPFQ
jgi:hypothetical protein